MRMGFDTQFDFLDVSPYTIDVSPMISTPTPNYVSKPMRMDGIPECGDTFLNVSDK